MSKKEKEPDIKEESLNEGEETNAENEAAEEKTKEQELEEQLAAAKDSYLRTAAEYANYRARSAKEKEQDKKTKTEFKRGLRAQTSIIDDPIDFEIPDSFFEFNGNKKSKFSSVLGV